MRQVAISDELASRVEAEGLDIEVLLTEALERALREQKVVPGLTLGQMMEKGFKLPSFEGQPRADGRAWSEIEAACDPE